MVQHTVAIAIGLACTFACAASYKSETMGVAPVGVGSAKKTTGVAIATKHDRVEVSYFVTTPRALQLEYKVTCPGGELTGLIGESWEDYQERRLAELERARQQEVQTKASIVSTVVGQVDGRVQARSGPAHAEVQAGVDGQALGQAVGEETTAKAQLPAWDIGAQSLKETLRVSGGEAGTCSMSVWPADSAQDASGITGTIKVVQVIDKARVRREQRAVADEAAISVRVDLRKQLIASGADPDYHAKQRAIALAKRTEELAIQAEARRKKREADQLRRREAAEVKIVARPLVPQPVVRVEVSLEEKEKARRKAEEKARLRADFVAKSREKARVEARVAAEAAAKVAVTERDAELRVRAALSTRQRLQSYCVGNGADPYYRARQRQANFDRQQANERQVADKEMAEAARRQEERLLLEAQVGYDLHTRTSIVATLIARGADPEYRRKQDEADLRAYEGRVRDAQYASLKASNATGRVEAQTTSGGMSTVGSLVVTTQVARPPVPAAPTSSRPQQPSSNASWIAGFYEWKAGAWVWVPGTWSIPPVQDAIWVPAVEINIGGSVVLQPGSWRNRRGQRVKRSSSRRNAHDHRSSSRR